MPNSTAFSCGVMSFLGGREHWGELELVAAREVSRVRYETRDISVFAELSRLDIVVHAELVGMGAPPHGVHFVHVFLLDPSFDDILGEHVSTHQEVMIFGQSI